MVVLGRVLDLESDLSRECQRASASSRATYLDPRIETFRAYALKVFFGLKCDFIQLPSFQLDQVFTFLAGCRIGVELHAAPIVVSYPGYMRATIAHERP